MGAPVLLERAELTGDQRPSPGAARLLELRRRAIVADEGIGHDHQLAGVRGIGEHLLVAGHAGVDDDFTTGVGCLTTTLAEHGEAVLEDEDHRLRHAASSAPSLLALDRRS